MTQDMTRLSCASALLIIGLLVSLGGAAWTAWAVIIDEKTAIQLASPNWDINLELKLGGPSFMRLIETEPRVA